MRLVVDKKSTIKFTAKTFISLLLVLSVYALIKSRGSILSFDDIVNNFGYILLMYTAVNIACLIFNGSIRFSVENR
jgi:hypothetical protein